MSNELVKLAIVAFGVVGLALKKTRDRGDDPVCGVSHRWLFVCFVQLPRQVGPHRPFDSIPRPKKSLRQNSPLIASCNRAAACFASHATLPHFVSISKRAKSIHRRVLGGLHSREDSSTSLLPHTSRSIVWLANCRQPRRELLLFSREAASPSPADSLTDRSLASPLERRLGQISC